MLVIDSGLLAAVVIVVITALLIGWVVWATGFGTWSGQPTKTHIRVPSVEGAINPSQRAVTQEYVRVNNLGRRRTYICEECAGPYFNDYQWNARLKRPVTCEECGVLVVPDVTASTPLEQTPRSAGGEASSHEHGEPQR